MSEFISAFDLLEGDVDGKGLKQLQDRLFEMKKSLKSVIDSGLDPETFAKAKRVLDACSSAEDVVVLLHKKVGE